MLYRYRTQSKHDGHAVGDTLFRALLACALSAACFLGTLPAFSQASQEPGVSGLLDFLPRPLAKDDPRAQLNPELQNAQPMPPPERVSPFAQDASAQEPAMFEFNVLKGVGARSKGYAIPEIAQEPLRSVPVVGFSATAPQSVERSVHSALADIGSSASCADNSSANHNVWGIPMSAQVKLFMTFPNGLNYQGSGTMIGNKYVLTSMDNVYYPAFGGLAARIEVVPGLDGLYKPFGSAFASYIRYFYDGSSRVGLLTLDRYIGNSTGWLGYGSFTDAYLLSRWGHQFSYPADKDYGRVLYYNNGAIQNVNRDWLTVAVTFGSGQMGGGFYLLDSYGNRYVFGVTQNTWYCGSWGSRLTDWITGQLRYVINNGI